MGAGKNAMLKKANSDVAHGTPSLWYMSLAKSGENGTRYGPDKSVYSYCAVAIKSIAIDDIVHALPERHQRAHSDESTRDDLWDPGDIGG